MGESIRLKTLKKADRPRVLVPSEYIEENKIDPSTSETINVINQYLSNTDPNETVFLTPNTRKMSVFMEAYFSIMIRYSFAGAFTTKWDYTPIPIEPFLPNKSDCVKLLELVKNAKKPCMIIGSQALLDSSRKDELRLVIFFFFCHKTLAISLR